MHGAVVIPLVPAVAALTAVGGAISAVVCTPPYALGRIGLLLLGRQQAPAIRRCPAMPPTAKLASALLNRGNHGVGDCQVSGRPLVVVAQQEINWMRPDRLSLSHLATRKPGSLRACRRTIMTGRDSPRDPLQRRLFPGPD